MKKTLLILFSLVFIGFNTAGAFEGIEGQAVYNPQTQIWSTGSMADGRIVLTKKTSSGSGGYSEYYYSDGQLAIHLSSNYEFIFDGKLICVNNFDLNFSQIIYKDNEFSEKALTLDEIQEIFPDAEIVKLSQFDNGKITLYKNWFAKKTILLVNDTGKNYYRYSYKPKDVKNEYITGLVTLKTPGKIKFSHYGDSDGMLTINVRNGK